MTRALLQSLLALTLTGAGLSASGCQKSAGAAAPAAQADGAPTGVRRVELKVTAAGYEPSPLTLRQGQPVELTVTRTSDETCATELVLDEHAINVKLPLNEPVKVAFTPAKAGELRYGCAMDKMVAGTFRVE
jgi:plastocyanin domain-containing protein